MGGLNETMQKIVNRWPLCMWYGVETISMDKEISFEWWKKREKICRAIPFHAMNSGVNYLSHYLKKKWCVFFQFCFSCSFDRSFSTLYSILKNTRHIDSINGIDFFSCVLVSVCVLIVLMTPEFFGLWHVNVCLCMFVCVRVCVWLYHMRYRLI